ncbi:MAG: hypothetical protein AB8H86_05670 [Polyangiales bacterium]
MGWGIDFGPPKAKGFDPHGDWRGERKLSQDELKELVRLVESWGTSVDSDGDTHFVEVPCEEFMFDACGGYLSKPGAGSDRDRDDEVEAQLLMAERICDFAGWVIVGEGYYYGFTEEANGYKIHTAPPETRKPAAPSLLSVLVDASTSSALEKALAEFRAAGAELPLGDAGVLFALLVSHDESVVADALLRLEALDPAPKSTELRQGRLRRVATLSGDPDIAQRATALRQRLRD